MSEPKLTGRASDFLKIGVATAGRGDLDGLKALLEVKSHWLARVGSHGRTMLWEAAYRGRTEVVQYLLERGADIDAHGCHFTPLLVEVSPLTAAKYKKHETTAELLVAQGAPTDIFNETFLGNSDYVLDALRAEPSLALTEKPQHDSNVKVTALHYAVSTSQLELLECSYRPRRESQTLLHVADKIFCVAKKRRRVGTTDCCWLRTRTTVSA